MESIHWLLTTSGADVCFGVFKFKLHIGKLVIEADHRLLTRKENASEDTTVNERGLVSIIKHTYFRHTKVQLQVKCLLSNDTVKQFLA